MCTKRKITRWKFYHQLMGRQLFPFSVQCAFALYVQTLSSRPTILGWYISSDGSQLKFVAQDHNGANRQFLCDSTTLIIITAPDLLGTFMKVLL
jgi:hypothetical protein